MDNINLEKILKSEEIDQNLILNVPEEIGLKIQKIIQSEENEGRDVHIEIIQSMNDKITLEESRKLIFKINDVLLPVTILDYPCIIEAQKTMDYKTFYKSGDISQMLFVHEKPIESIEAIADFNPFKEKDVVFNNIIWGNDPDHKYKLRHGLTKPTKNIRSRRFKAKQRYDRDEISNVCKKLKQIIDNGAANFEKSLNINNANNTSIVDEKSLKVNHDNYSITNQSNAIDNSFDNESVRPNNFNSKIVIPSMGNNNASTEKSKSESKKTKSPLIKIINNTTTKKESDKPSEVKPGVNNEKNNNTLINSKQSESTINNNSKIKISNSDSKQPSKTSQTNTTTNQNKIKDLPLKEEDYDNYQKNINQQEKDTKIKLDMSVSQKISTIDLTDDKELRAEYADLKVEYDALKIYINDNPNDKEKIKQRKKIKKRLKGIKAEIDAMNASSGKINETAINDQEEDDE